MSAVSTTDSRRYETRDVELAIKGIKTIRKNDPHCEAKNEQEMKSPK